MKSSKNKCFFQCKNAVGACRETPPEGAINSPCGHQMLLFDMNRLHSPNWKRDAQNEDKMKKPFWKKWVWRQLHTLSLPRAASLKKGCLNEHHAAARRAFLKTSTTLQRDARLREYAVNCNGFIRKSCDGKKSKKEKSNKTYVFFQSGCDSCSKTICFISKDAWPQNHNNKRATLRPEGFVWEWWQSDTKSDDSYTKREVATVQGAQQ